MTKGGKESGYIWSGQCGKRQQIPTPEPAREKELARSLHQPAPEVSPSMHDRRKSSWLVTGGQVTQLWWVGARREGDVVREQGVSHQGRASADNSRINARQRHQVCSGEHPSWKPKAGDSNPHSQSNGEL